jgi:hypothetical protein
MSAYHHYIINQRARALSEGLKIVRDILKSNRFPNGFTTAELFQIAVQQPPPPDFPIYNHPVAGKIKPETRLAKPLYWKFQPSITASPSYPEHPIRSIRCVPFFF